jgi:glucose/arabinose dehydrogenase
MKRIVLFSILFLLLVGCNISNLESKPEKKTEQEVVSILSQPESIAEKLKVPWSITKQGNAFYISEREGNIVKIEDGVTTRQKVLLEKRIATAAEAGLLGFVLAPDFEQSKKAYAYYTYSNSSGQFNRIIEMQLSENTWKEERILIDKIPSGPVHHGGRLEIGPDGKLYATTGDASLEPEVAQDLKSFAGKILRLNLNGSVPSDNPFKGSYVYSYGHRNPQGLAWSRAGTLYESEHGPSAHDEINVIKAGQNYGWPVIIGDEKKAGMAIPLFQSGKDTWAPSGMAYYEGKLYVATLRGNSLREFDPEKLTTRTLVSGLGRIRDVLIDGEYLYFVTNNTDGRGTPNEKDDKLYRIKISAE